MKYLPQSRLIRAPWIVWTPALAALACGHLGIALDGERSELDASSAQSGSSDQSASSTGEPSGLASETLSSDSRYSTLSDNTSAGTTIDSTTGRTRPVKDRDAGIGKKPPGKPYKDAGVVGPSGDSGQGADADTALDAAITDASVQVDGAVVQDASGAERDADVVQLDSSAVSDAHVRHPDSGTNWTCAPAGCACEQSAVCDLTCLTAECSLVCDPGSRCEVMPADAGKVEVNCKEGAECHILSVGPSAEIQCSGAGDCSAECGAGQTCNLSCEGAGRCWLDCADGADCKVGCQGDGPCYIKRENLNTPVVLECNGELKSDCGPMLVCKGQCPG